MGVAIVAERRLLTENEYGPVARSHYPTLESVPRDELVDLARWLRSQRAKANDIVQHRCRVRRGKPDLSNTVADTSSERGLSAKKKVFSRALKRVNARLHRFRDEEKRDRNLARLNAALERKRNATVHHPRAGRTARLGMAPNQNPKSSGVIEPSDIGRVSESVRNSQAQRDNRDK